MRFGYIYVCLIMVCFTEIQAYAMKESLKHILSEMGMFRMEMSFLTSRMDKIEETVEESEHMLVPANGNGAPDIQQDVVKELLDYKKEMEAEFVKMKKKMNDALRGISKEKRHTRNLVMSLEKLVRSGDIGDDVEKRLLELEDKVASMGKQNGNFVRNNVKNVQQVAVSGDVRYSFSTRLDDSLDIVPNPRAKQLGHKMHSKRLHFSDVLHNDGDVYNPVTGKFTCKKDGVYLFTFFVEGIFRAKFPVNGQTSMVALSVDGKYQTLAASKAFNVAGRNTGGNSVILKLIRGQQVWLETVAPISQMITLRQWVSTFSGTLLY